MDMTDRILKELTELGINYFTQLFNAIPKIGYFSPQVESRSNNHDSKTQ